MGCKNATKMGPFKPKFSVLDSFNSFIMGVCFDKHG